MSKKKNQEPKEEIPKNGEALENSWDGVVFCSFCLKPSNEAALVIAGPVSYICDECIITAYGVLKEKGIA